MPRHALSARAVEEMWRYIALVGTLIPVHGFNSGVEIFKTQVKTCLFKIAFKL